MEDGVSHVTRDGQNGSHAVFDERHSGSVCDHLNSHFGQRVLDQFSEYRSPCCPHSIQGVVEFKTVSVYNGSARSVGEF